MPEDEVEGLLISANAGKSLRTHRLGLRWLQNFRREKGSMAPALIYSFESRNSLAREFPLASIGMPGVDYFRLPNWCDVEAQLSSIAPLTHEELNEFVRWFSGLQQQWHRYAHELFRAVRGRCNDEDHPKQIVRMWAASIRRYAPDQVPLLKELQDAINKMTCADSIDIARIIEMLESGLCFRDEDTASVGGEIPEAPYRRPARGLSTIAIADDQGYELHTIHELNQLGYAIGGPAQNLTEARHLLEYWSPKIFLADLNFPSRAEGLAIMRDALAANCIVIAVSRAAVEPGELPAGVENCSGALNFQSAERIHRLIWKHALSRGITSHE
jgi:hypothetical protein